MEDRIIKPEDVIMDLYGNDVQTIQNELFEKISMKDYEHDEKLLYIIVIVRNLNYNPVVLNEIKRRYLSKNWGNVFYKIRDNNTISFQLYFQFPQIKQF